MDSDQNSGTELCRVDSAFTEHSVDTARPDGPERSTTGRTRFAAS